MTEDQIAFKNHVEANGETYLLLHDDMRPLTTWLEAHGLKELGKNEHRSSRGELGDDAAHESPPQYLREASRARAEHRWSDRPLRHT
jgi:hypothetical protein